MEPLDTTMQSGGRPMASGQPWRDAGPSADHYGAPRSHASTEALEDLSVVDVLMDITRERPTFALLGGFAVGVFLGVLLRG